MNKIVNFPLLAILAIATIIVVGCDKDDDFDELDTNLDINYNIPTTRSAGEDGFIGDPETIKRQNYKANTSYSKLPAGCGITMLVDIWISGKSREYFEVSPSECTKTAQQYADELLTSFGDKYNESTGIHLSDILSVANNGNPTESLSNTTFNSSSEKTDFFTDKNKRKQVCGITLTNTITGESHYAATTNVSSSSVTFSGFDIFNPDKNRYGSYSIPVDGLEYVNKKDGSDGGAWKITGVFLH